MRLFLAVEPSEAARAQLTAVLADLRRALADSQSAFRWVPAENVHITMHFLGEIDRARADVLVHALAPPLAQPAFDVMTSAAGAFPAAGPPKVLWIGLAEGAPALTTVHAELGARLRDAGVPTEARPFSPHLTVARVRDRDRTQAREARRQLHLVPCPPIRWRVDRVVLMQSDLSGATPTYTALAHVGLS